MGKRDAYMREYYLKNRERIIARNKAYVQRLKDAGLYKVRVKIYRADEYEKNKADYQRRGKEKWERNKRDPEKLARIREKNRRYWEKNKLAHKVAKGLGVTIAVAREMLNDINGRRVHSADDSRQGRVSDRDWPMGEVGRKSGGEGLSEVAG